MDRAVLERIQAVALHSRRASRQDFLGALRSRRRGAGLEYAESRTYEPGDDVRRIDWKVTARRGTLHTKLFEQERRLHIAVAVDTSSSMHLGVPTRTKLESATTLAAMLGFAALHRSDSAEIWLFDSTVHTQLGPFRNRTQLWTAVDELERWERPPYGDNRTTQFEALARHALALRRRPQILFVASDFDAGDLQLPMVQDMQSLMDMVPLAVVSQLEQATARRVRIRYRDYESQQPATNRVVAPASLWGRTVATVTDTESLPAALSRVLQLTHSGALL